MAAPTKYEPSFSFSGFQGTNPTRPLPGPRHDVEYNNIADALGGTIDALNDIRRDDGKLENGIVDWDSLAPGTFPYPDAPQDGLIYGRQDLAWRQVIAPPADAFPPNPTPGMSFWHSGSGRFFVYYQDVDSAQWVEVGGGVSTQVTLAGGVRPASLYYLATAAQTVFPLTAPDRFGVSITDLPASAVVHVVRSGTRLAPDGYSISGSTVTLASPAGAGEPITFDVWG